MDFMDGVANYINANKPACVNSFVLWLGRAYMKNPQTVTPKKVDMFIKHFIHGAVYFPIVFLCNQITIPLIKHSIIHLAVETKWFPEEMINEIATFSLLRRILAPIAMIFYTSVVIPFVEELFLENFYKTQF